MSLTMYDYKEKRDFIRMPIDAGITLATMDDQTQLPATCKDLSGGGMGINLQQAVEIGTEFKTSLPSHNSKFPGFETKIRVVRCLKIHNTSYRIGAEIVEVLN